MPEYNGEEMNTKVDTAILQALSKFSPLGNFSLTTKPTTLSAEVTYNRNFLENTSAATADELIRCDLGHKIAAMMLDEDLVLVEQNTDINTDKVTFRARVKIIQE